LSRQITDIGATGFNGGWQQQK